MAHYKVIIYLRTHSYHASIVIVTLKTQKKEKHKLGGLSPCGNINTLRIQVGLQSGPKVYPVF